MRLAPIPPLERLGPAPGTPATSAAPPYGGFDRVLADLLGSASTADAQATQDIQDLATGEAEDVHTAAIAVAQADLSFRLALDIRNRLIEAYQEIIRLQI